MAILSLAEIVAFVNFATRTTRLYAQYLPRSWYFQVVSYNIMYCYYAISWKLYVIRIGTRPATVLRADGTG